jgi:hypothetical protein
MSFDRPTRLAMSFLAAVFCLGALHYDGRSLGWAPSKVASLATPMRTAVSCTGMQAAETLKELSGEFADFMPEFRLPDKITASQFADFMPDFKLSDKITAIDTFKTFTPELVLPDFKAFTPEAA